MSDPRLPPELRDLEEELSRRLLPAPSDALKARVLESLCDSLARERARGSWSWAAGAAAALALLANLSSTPAPIGAIGPPGAPEGASVERAAQLIRETLPEITESEALRQAILIAAAARIPPFFAPPAPPGAMTLDSSLEHLENGE